MKSYFSIALILSLFIVALITNGCEEEEVIGYNCVNSSCVSSENAQYVSIEDCLLACSNNGGGNNTTTWNCLNYSCVESTQNIGLYTSLADCQTACTSGNGGSGGSGSGGSGSGSVSSYNCNNGNCIDPGDGSGAYTNLSSCLSNCGNISDCDDNYTINNTTTFELGEGPSEIVNFGYGQFWSPNTTNFEVRLFTSSVSGDADGPSYYGTGNLVLLDLHTDGTAEGTYSFHPYNPWGGTPPVNSYTPRYFINQDMYMYSMDMAFPNNATSSSYLTITDDGDDEYTIDFEFNTSNGVFNGCYSGELDYWDAYGGSGSGSGSGLTNGSEPYRKTKNPNLY